LPILKPSSYFKAFAGACLGLCLSLGLSAATPTAEADPELILIPPPSTGTAQANGVVATPPYVTPSASAGGLVAPGFLTAIAGNRSVLLSWYPSEGNSPISGYLVYRGENPAEIPAAPINKGAITESNYSDNDDASLEGPRNRHTYYYRVQAFDTDGRLSPYSEIVSAAPNGPLLPPAKLEGIESDGKVRLRWSLPLSSGEFDIVALQLFRGAVSGEATLLKELPPDATSFEDAGLENGKPYYYTLKSKDSAGNLSGAAPELKVVTFRPLPAPKGLSALGVGDEAVRLKWAAPEPAPGATFKLKGYHLYRDTKSPVDLTGRPVNKSLIPAGKTKWEDGPEDSVEAPKKGTDYHYVLVAVDEQDKYSPPSNESVAGPVASLTKLETGELELAKDSTLKIEGRKTINASNTWVVPQLATGVAGGFQLDQQLQVRLSGKVGRKIKVDVDYDDKAVGSQQQKISVVYSGDQQEVFKEFAFGDIVMDLNSPRTEFAGYNKSLFGAKLKLESPDSRLRLTAIGAQTKGTTETKRIVGGFEQAKTGANLGRDIPDTAFSQRRYYYLTRDRGVVEGGDYIDPGSVTIYIDQQALTRNDPQSIAVPDINGTDTFSFVRMIPGQDFTVDSNTGLVTFTNQGRYINNGDTLAVAFRIVRLGGTVENVGYKGDGVTFDFSPGGLDSDVNGGQTSPAKHLIQYGRRYGNQWDSHMSFQFYNLGNRDILSPSLDPDFKLVVYGTNQTPIYQLNPLDNFSDVVNFDARQGLMTFRVPFPFAKSTSGPNDLRMDSGFTKVEQVFQPNGEDSYNLGRAQQNFTIHMEYKYKVASYSLRFNIVRGSEYITLDGRKLTRDVDYFLDYDVGSLVFSSPDLVKDNSVVEATYEYLPPFGGSFTSTIWGTRGEYDVNKNLSVGSTFVWNASDAPQDVPDIRSSPYSVQLLDGDIQASFPQDVLDDIMRNVPGLSGQPSPLKVAARAEAAKSWYRPNTYTKNNENGLAMVDSFEAVSNVLSTGTDANIWEPSSAPLTIPGNPAPSTTLNPSDRRFGKVVNEQQPAHDAQARSANNENPSRSMLVWDYSGFDDPAKWDAFVYSFGPNPQTEISNATYLEAWVKVDPGQSVNLVFDVGEVNEDATGNNTLDQESSTGYLAADQDTGFYNPQSVPGPYPLPDAAPSLYTDLNYWGRDNKVIDGEDLDNSGYLNTANNFYRLRPSGPITSTPDKNGFRFIQIPLTSAQVFATNRFTMSLTPGDLDFYKWVKHVRVWISGSSTSSGRVSIESIQFVGNKWQVRADPNVTVFAGLSASAETKLFRVNAINRQTQADVAPGFPYTPNLNFFRKEGSLSDDREQSLQVEYALTNLEQDNGRPFFLAVKALTSGQDLDLGNYQKLRVDLYKPHDTLPGERFLVRLGYDDANYFEYQVLMDQVPTGSWTSVALALDGSDGRRIQVGRPFLRTVRTVALSMHTLNTNLNSDPRLKENRELLWVNNLRVTDALTKEGSAQRLGMTYDLLGGKVVVTEDLREVDSDFTKVDHQDDAPSRKERKHTVDGRIGLVEGLPLTARYEDVLRYTEQRYREDPRYSRNFQDPDESSNRTSLGAGFTMIPRLNVNAAASLEHVRQIYLPTYTDSQRLLYPADDRQFNPNANRDNLRLTNDDTYKIPERIWVFGNDDLQANLSFDETKTMFDQQTLRPDITAYKDTELRIRSMKGRHSGQYKPAPWVTLSPSYAYTLVEADGNVALPVVRLPYYDLGPERRSKGWLPQTRAINPSLQAQFDSLGPLRTPRIGYSATQQRDYVRNELTSQSSLDFSTSLELAKLSSDAASKLPALDFTQSFNAESTTNNEQRVRGGVRAGQMNTWLRDNPDFSGRYGGVLLQDIPSVALAEQQPFLQSGWWMRLEDFGLGENFADPLNVENIAQRASKRSSTSLSTRFTLPLAPNWEGAFTPRLTLSNNRNMPAPEQVTREYSSGVGTGLDFANPHVPFWQTLKPSSLSFNYSLNNRDNFVVVPDREDLISNSVSQSLAVTLPTRPTDRNTITLSTDLRTESTKNFSQGTVSSTNEKNEFHPSLKWVYLLSVDRPWKLPDLWPFNGRELRIRQNFTLDNLLDATFSRSNQTVSSAALPATATDRYGMTNTIGYNVLDNVKLNFILIQEIFQDNSTLANGQAVVNDRDYYSFRFELGLEAKF
jgi:hypothetical protein